MEENRWCEPDVSNLRGILVTSGRWGADACLGKSSCWIVTPDD
jgi:hypothetical protein